MRSVLAAAVLLAGLMGSDRRLRAARRVKFIFGMPFCWFVLALFHAETGWPKSGWIAWPLWLVLVALMFAFGQHLVPDALRRFFASLFPDDTRLGAFRDGGDRRPPPRPGRPGGRLHARHHAGRAAQGRCPVPAGRHILTCAPTGAGKGVGAVIPNLLTYPGSTFVLDLKGENYAVTARARRELDQHVVLVDPFGITGQTTHALNWLDILDPDSPDVVSRAAGLADMLIAVEGPDTDSHWTDTARELLRGLLVYGAILPAPRRSMAELRRIVTASEDDLAATLADMAADPERGQRIPARAVAAHLNRPERERGSVLSTVVRHTAWLDDPRLCATLARSDFDMADLKRRPMTVYLAIPPDRLRACLRT